MKAFHIGPQTGINSLVPVEVPEPVAGPGQVVVRPTLVSLINRDAQILKGIYAGKLAENRIPVSEGVGVIASVGEGVEGFAVGERVIASHFPNWLDGRFSMFFFSHDVGVTHDGWLAENIVLPANALIKVPEALADKDVAGLSSVALTAWNALVHVGRVKAGDLVLCLGTGGVSMAALQIAKMHGAQVATTSSSDEKLEVARKLGADITINYTTHSDWADELHRQTEGRGADIIIETGGQDTLGLSIEAAAVNGLIAVIGVTSGEKSPIPFYPSFILKNITIRGIANGSRAMFQDLLAAMVAHGSTTLEARTFAFDDAADAYAFFDKAGHIGKVFIQLKSDQ